MVQQMIDKVNEYGIVNSGIAMTTEDKQQPISIKRLALGNLPSETGNTIPIAEGNSPLIKEGGSVSASMKVSGTKRQQSCYPLSPARAQPSSTCGTNGHLVYVRRRHETESAKAESSHSAFVKKPTSDCGGDPKSQPGTVLGVSASPLPALTTVSSASLGTPPGKATPAYSAPNPLTELPLPAPNHSTVPTTITVQPEIQSVDARVSIESEPQSVPTAVPAQPEPKRQRDQCWEERNACLQMYLKKCDESNQEEYIQSKCRKNLRHEEDSGVWSIYLKPNGMLLYMTLELRSMSAEGRSKIAYELELRAMRLVYEEDYELYRMKVLNDLGKASPNGHHAA